MKALLSIISPVYNVESYLDRCIQSILTQSYYDIELILIDDGSTDGSSVLCDKWVVNDSRVKVIHKENGGVASARNKGLQIAKGEYVTFVDSDDLIVIMSVMMIFQTITNLHQNCLLEQSKSLRIGGQEVLWSMLFGIKSISGIFGMA